VLGLGDQVQNNAPQATFSFDYQDGGPYTVVATHDGGDTFTEQNTNSLTLQDADGSETTDFALSGGVSAGDSAQITDVDANTDVRIIWTSANGGNTATVASGTTPN
jgi:hypothetical protein